MKSPIPPVIPPTVRRPTVLGARGRGATGVVRVTTVALAALSVLPSGAAARQARPGADTDGWAGTRAVPFMARGAVAGGTLLGLAGAALGGGLCDAADCSGAGAEGFLWGALIGLIGGGITGLVAGSALRAPGVDAPTAPPERAWTGRAGVGGGRAEAGEIEGWRIVAAVALVRPTVRRVHFGIEGLYLGTNSTNRETRITTIPAHTFVDREHTRWNVFGLVMTARVDDAIPGGGVGGFLTVSSGMYPILKSHQVDRSGDVPAGTPAGRFVDESEILPLPGVGLGVGYAVSRGARTMEVRTRLHGILGAGNSALLPLFELTGGVRFR